MKKEHPMKMLTVTVDDSTREKARKIGKGNLSLGIRTAVKQCPIRAPKAK